MRSAGSVSALALAEQLVVGRRGLQALGVVQVLAVDLHRHFAVVRNAVGLAVDRVGVAPGLDDVVVPEPGRVGQRCVVQVLVERIDPLVGDVQRVVHRVGGVRRIGAGLRRQVEHRLLADLARRHLLEAQLDAGQRLELRLQRDQVDEVAGRNDGDGDRSRPRPASSRSSPPCRRASSSACAKAAAGTADRGWRVRRARRPA